MRRRTTPTITGNPDAALPADKPTARKTQLVAKLQRADGASIEEMSEQFGWQPHTARAMLSGLRKAGLTIDRIKQGSVTVYRIPV